MVSEIDLRRFTESFFKKMNASVVWDGDVLRVENVHPKFEAFVGKKSPYEFVFEGSLKNESNEFLSKGCYFINAMANFLENKSKNTLIKIDFDVNPMQEIDTRFTFLNTEIEKIDIRKDYDYFSRFTFSNSMQYLNETEQETIPICVYNGKIINFSLSRYKYGDGKKEEIKIGNIKSDFELAQKKLKERINTKILRLKNMLAEKLDRELKRVGGHFNQQILEIEEIVGSGKEQLKKLERELENSVGEERDKKIKKIDRIKREILNVDLQEKKKELEKEKAFFLSDERHKYGLNVSNSLINTSIIYYPKFKFIVHLKNSSGKGRVVLEYDPMQKHMPAVKCDSSGKELYKLYMCAAGKICNENELVECIESGKLYCKSVMDIKCGHCHKPVYIKNAVFCPKTRKYYAKSYMKTDHVTGEKVYMGLLQFCPASGFYTTKDRFKKCPVCHTNVSQMGMKKGIYDGSLIEFCKLCNGRKKVSGLRLG